MRKTSRIWVGILTSLMLAEPIVAVAKEACLQHNRLKNWRAVNAETLLYTDWTGKKYLVNFRGPCPNLTSSTAILVIGSEWLDLSCLRRGDPIRVAGVGLAMSTCRVASVEFAEPDRAAG
jgi:hypothetical protein